MLPMLPKLQRGYLKPVDYELSQQIAEAVKAELKACWRNAFMGLYELPDATYVEGWAVTLWGLLVIEHGWLEYQGKIVDPTAALWDELRGMVYFPGLRFDRDQAREGMEKSATCEPGDLPIAWRYGWGGFQSKDYKASYEAALAYIQKMRDEEGSSNDAKKINF